MAHGNEEDAEFTEGEVIDSPLSTWHGYKLKPGEFFVPFEGVTGKPNDKYPLGYTLMVDRKTKRPIRPPGVYSDCK